MKPLCFSFRLSSLQCTQSVCGIKQSGCVSVCVCYCLIPTFYQHVLLLEAVIVSSHKVIHHIFSQSQNPQTHIHRGVTNISVMTLVIIIVRKYPFLILSVGLKTKQSIKFIHLSKHYPWIYCRKGAKIYIFCSSFPLRNSF